MFAVTSLGDRVWLDTNGNGLQDVGEPGLGNVTVWLMKGSQVIASTVTTADGTYHFPNLVPGTYIVQFDIPAGYVVSPANRGNNSALDSDIINPSTGQTSPITLVSGMHNEDIDAGMSQGMFIFTCLHSHLSVAIIFAVA